MQKFCTGCGTIINDKYKFCPECGTEIIKTEQEKNFSIEQTHLENSLSKPTKKVIICDNCGDENDLDANICNGCGAKLTSKNLKTVSTKDRSQTSKSNIEIPKKKPDISKSKNYKRKRKTNVNKAISHEKEFDSKKLYLIASVIGIFALVILFSSGVFDSDITTVSNKTVDQSNGSGIDLTSIQRINELEAKLNANPDDTATLLELAHLQNDSGFYNKAIPLYERYLNKFPSDANVRIDMGVCYYNLGNYEKAIKVMKKALEYDPKHQIGHLNLGIVNLTAGNVAEAEKWFKKTIELGPDTDAGKRAKELLNSHNL
jgi:TolA-binding protein